MSDQKFGKGYIPRDYSAMPLGSAPYCKAFDLELIPEDEWKDRVDYLAEQEADLLTLAQHEGIEASDQNGYGYCWAHGGVNALRVIRAKEGQPYADLSATGPAAKIKNFRDQGGNTFEIIPFLAEVGCPTFATFPQNKLDRKHDNPRTWEEAALYRMDEWLELEPNNFNQKATCLLNLIPVTAGYAHWGHMVCDLRLQYRETRRGIEWGVRGLNSWKPNWGPYGDGTYELWGAKAISFDQAAPAVARVAA